MDVGNQVQTSLGNEVGQFKVDEPHAFQALSLSLLATRHHISALMYRVRDFHNIMACHTYPCLSSIGGRLWTVGKVSPNVRRRVVRRKGADRLEARRESRCPIRTLPCFRLAYPYGGVSDAVRESVCVRYFKTTTQGLDCVLPMGYVRILTWAMGVCDHVWIRLSRTGSGCGRGQERRC